MGSASIVHFSGEWVELAFTRVFAIFPGDEIPGRFPAGVFSGEVAPQIFNEFLPVLLVESPIFWQMLGVIGGRDETIF